MSHQGTILHILPGQVMPKEDYEKLSKGANVFGCAFVMDGVFMEDRTTEVMDADTFLAFQEEYKAVSRLVFLGTFPEGHLEEDRQPYIWSRDEDDKPEVIVMIEGDFSNHHKPDQTKAAETFWIENVLDPMVAEYGEKYGDKGSVSGFLDWLDGNGQKEKLLSSSLSRGCITLMTNKGKIKQFHKNEIGGTYPWGSATQKPIEAAPAKTTGIHKFKKFFNKAEAPKEEPKPTIPEPGKTGTVIDNPPPPVTPDTAAPPSVGKVFVRASGKLGAKKRADLYNGLIGCLPKGYNKDPAPWVECEVSKLVGVKQHYYELQNPNALTGMADAMLKAGGKDVSLKNPEIAEKALPTTMVVPANQAKDFIEKFCMHPDVKKAMETSSAFSLEQLQKIEEKFPTFFEKSGGKKLDHVYGLSPERRIEFFSQYPHMANLWAQGMISEAMKRKTEGHVQEETEEKEVAPAPVGKSKFVRKAA